MQSEVVFIAVLALICLVFQIRKTVAGDLYGTAAAVLLAVCAVLCVVAALLAVLNAETFKGKILSIERWLSKEQHRLSVMVMTALFIVSASGGIILLSSRFAHYLGEWENIFGQSRGLVYFVYLLGINAFLLVLVSGRDQIRQKTFWNFKTLFTSSILFLLIGMTLLHWMILLYQVRLFKMIPGWFWGFHEKKFQLNDLYVLFMLLVLIAGVFVIGRIASGRGLFGAQIGEGKKIAWVGILACMLIFYVLQIGFGFIEGGGYESIRLKYAASTHKGYAEHASDRPLLPDALIEYEQRYAADHYLGTKPPGVLLIYAGLQKLSNLLLPVQTFDERVERLTWMMTWVFPVIALLAIYPLYLLGRALLGENKAFLPVLLYITCPNVLLMPLFLDQVLYPLMFLMGIWMAWWIVKRASLTRAFLFGVYCFVVLYFSFSMLPLVALGALWIGVELLLRRETRNFRKAAWVLLGFTSGFLLLALLFRFLLNYDPLLRYQMAMLKHTSLKLFEPGFGPFMLNTLLNNIEMASWIGFPVFLLAMVGIVYAVYSVAKRESQLNDRFFLCCLMVYITLNIFSKTRGEVGRVWIFMVPVFCLAAIKAVQILFKQEQKAVSALVLIQFITTYLLFKFQDFIT